MARDSHGGRLPRVYRGAGFLDGGLVDIAATS